MGGGSGAVKATGREMCERERERKVERENSLERREMRNQRRQGGGGGGGETKSARVAAAVLNIHAHTQHTRRERYKERVPPFEKRPHSRMFKKAERQAKTDAHQRGKREGM